MPGWTCPSTQVFFNDWADPDDPEDSESEWIQNLTALIHASKATSAGFKRSRGVGNDQHVDKGGNTNLFKEESRPPDFSFVVEGWRLFEKFRPNEAKGTEGGLFHTFLQNVYEYATGLEAESYSGVSTWIKRLAVFLRTKDDLLARSAGLAMDLEYVTTFPNKEELQEVEEALQQKLKAVNQEISQHDRVLSQVKIR